MTHSRFARHLAAFVIILASPIGSLRAAPDDTLGMALLSATVDDATPAHIVRGSGAISANRAGIGTVDVAFDRDLSNCTCTANVGSNQINSWFTVDYATANCPFAANSARVVTVGPNGGLFNVPFHLIVFCPK